MSDLTYQDVIRILTLVDQAEGMDLELTMGDLHLKVVRGAGHHPAPVPAAVAVQQTGVAKGPAPATAPDAAPTPRPDLTKFPDALPVLAPMGGMFYAAPAPNQPPFVMVGQKVKQGDQLGIVEVMKLFTPITAEADGEVVAIAVDNQQTVARGDVLMLIAPAQQG